MKKLLLVAGALALLLVAWWLREGAVDGARVVVRDPAAPAAEEHPPPPAAPRGLASSDRTEASPVAAPGDLAQGDVTGSLAVRVLHADGTPAAGTSVLLVARERELAYGICGAEGRLELERAREPAEVIALHPLLGVERAWVDASTTRIQLHLGESYPVAGVVRVDGLTPRKPLELTLASRDRDAPSSLPGPARRLLPQLRWEGERRFTGVAGEFRFLVPMSWRGELRLPPGLEFESGEEELQLEGPTAHLVLELRSQPALRGRVLASDGVTPARAARVRVGSRREHTGHDGRFTLPLRQERDPAHVIVFIDGARGEGHRRFVLADIDPGADLSRPHDLGDVVLDASHDLPFVVHDPSGAPIGGAVGFWVHGADGPPSAPTDDEGRGLLRGVFEEVEEASFVAPAHRRGVVELPWPRPDELEVELEPCASLEIVLVGAEGEPPPVGVSIDLSAPAQFESDSSRWRGQPDLRTWTGERVARSWGFSAQSVSLSGVRLLMGPEQTTAGAGLRIECIELGVPIAVRVVDDLGTVIVDLGTVELVGPGTRRIEALIDPAPRDLLLRISSPEGEPVGGAEVKISAGAAEHGIIFGGRTATTDAHGEVRFAGILSVGAELTVNAKGFAPLRLPDVSLLPDGRALELILDRGRSIELWIQDELEAPVAAQEVGARRDSLAVGQSQELEVGRYRVVGLPRDPVEIWARVGGRTFREPVASDAAEVRMTVPRPGSVLIEWSGHVAEEGGGVLVWLASETGAPERFELRAFTDLGADGTPAPLELPVVLPGRYELRLRRQTSKIGTQPSPPIPLEVRAGERTLLRIEPPGP